MDFLLVLIIKVIETFVITVTRSVTNKFLNTLKVQRKKPPLRRKRIKGGSRTKK